MVKDGTPHESDARTAFEGEVLPHADRLFRLAMWFERNRADAEDVVQETMMQALRSFHRFQPGWVGEHDEAGIQKSMEVVGNLDFPLAVQDVIASVAHLRGLPEVTGGVGVLGFCLGGTLAYAAAVGSDPDTAVSFYGSGVPDQIATLDQVSCPILFASI